MGKLALAGERVCKNRKRFFAVTKGGEMEGGRRGGRGLAVWGNPGWRAGGVRFFGGGLGLGVGLG